jgi:hypothetical protein
MFKGKDCSNARWESLEKRMDHGLTIRSFVLVSLVSLVRIPQLNPLDYWTVPRLHHSQAIIQILQRQTVSVRVFY